MSTYDKYLNSGLGRIIANTRPGRASIYLDGEVVLDSSGQIAKTPTIIYNVTEGQHTVTFSKSGYSDITIIANVKVGSDGSDCHARAVLDTSKWSYPMMLSNQPSPGWPYLPVQETPFGHMVANTFPDGAEIYIDRQPVRDINGNIAKTPASVIGIVTGTHVVTFRKAGYMDTNITVDIQNGLYSDASTTLLPV